MAKRKTQPQESPTLFNVESYSKPVHFYDLDNEGCGREEDIFPTGKNRAYTTGMKIGQVVEMLDDRKRGLVVAIVDGRHVRVWFPGGAVEKVCADDFEVNHAVRVQFTLTDDQCRDEYNERDIACLECRLKSSTVECNLVERENFLPGDSPAGDTSTTTDKSSTVERNLVERENFLPGDSPAGDTSTTTDKSSTVERNLVERENFQWVEQYAVKQYLYWRYCHLCCTDDIKQVVKLHIPGASRSIRAGRAQLVKEACALGKTPSEIEQLIKTWST